MLQQKVATILAQQTEANAFRSHCSTAASTPVFLGAAAFKIGRANVLGMLVANYFIAVNITDLTLAGVRDYVQPCSAGCPFCSSCWPRDA